MKPLQFSAPTSLDEALSLLSGAGDGAGVLSGGTDLIIQYREGLRDIGQMVDIKKIPELNVLEFDPVTGLRLGAAVSCALLGEFAPAREIYPGLVEGAELIGSTQIQNRATVGGNLCNGSPAADSVCSLMVLNAVCIVAGSGGKREVPAVEFMTGPGQTALQAGELLVEIRVPTPAPNSSDAYLRFIPRNEMDIAVAGTAVALTLEDDKQTVKAAVIAIGAVAPTPLMVPAAGKALTGTALTGGQMDDAALEAAARASEAAANPISDVRGTVEFRTHLAGVLTRRAAVIANNRAAAN
ncbi:MAG: xanthine dehydrogenase family protein subunit M [bacterium]